MSEGLALGEEPRRRFTADEVILMSRAGILGDHDHVELLGGELLLTHPQDPEHATIVTRLTRLLLAAYGEAFSIRVQMPLLAGRDDLPEPDLVVARGPESEYATRHPRGQDCVLVIEVCRTSEARDRRKGPVYAAAGVPVFWLVDLARARVEVHSAPDVAAGYKQVQLHEASVALPLRDGVALAARDLLIAER